MTLGGPLQHILLCPKFTFSMLCSSLVGDANAVTQINQYCSLLAGKKQKRLESEPCL